MNNESRITKRRKDSFSKFGTAFLFILAGVLLLGFNFGYISPVYKPIIISWQMLLIALGTVSLCKRHYTGGLILIAVGGIFIYPVVTRIFPEYFVGIDFNFAQWWPLILIIIGLVVIFSKNVGRRKWRKYLSEDHSWNTFNQNNASNTNRMDENVLFSGTEHIIFSQEFEGGEANVMFGEIKIDLRKAQLSPNDNFLKVACLFGSIQLYVPSDWNIKISKSVIFGGVEDQRRVSSEQVTDGKPVLNIKCDCLFGSIEIKN